MQQVDSESCLQMLLNWLISAYDRGGHGRIRVFSLKVALSHLCAGKLMDKLRYMFTQLCDSSGYLIFERFDEYLRELLALPTAVYEGPSFGYTENASRSCFDNKIQINVNDFLNVMMADQGPKCLMWLPIFQRMSKVENVFHPVQCEGCHRESFTGFRYKCQHCFNYNLCQDCFWRGRTSGNHNNDHGMKEYTTFKSPSKQLGHQIKKSVQCVPSRVCATENKIPPFSQPPEIALDLSFIIPPSPKFTYRSMVQDSDVSEEHRLIARYAARLAADAQNASRSPAELNFSLDTNKAQRELVLKLESKNREIMREIHRLRIEQEAHARSAAEVQYSPTLLVELRQLRQRKEELEHRMHTLQENRKELMVQLESLMNLLKINPTSPQSPSNGSSYVQSTSESPVRTYDYSKEPTSPAMDSDTLHGVGGDIHQAFNQPRGLTSIQTIRTDLLLATDSVTSAMSSLVKELNSDADISEDNDDIAEREATLEVADAYLHCTQESMEKWQQEVLKRADREGKSPSPFVRHIHPHHTNSLPSRGMINTSDDLQQYDLDDLGSDLIRDETDSFVKTDDSSDRADDDDAELYDQNPKELPSRMTSSTCTTDDDSYVQSDADSYIRTDDEEGGSTDWEESMKRWVNR
ncbi:hypothetical protein FSP39_011346 [Pinctada imbricata]|uniref:ZZ-type domain-containing protein n=1 Tax=Pinctada imbricata TaxID=66713 RepID=A0AA88XRC1_PINIB|nr:hypothetical protein FSP39_011346 [Pinctada imbricata]